MLRQDIPQEEQRPFTFFSSCLCRRGRGRGSVDGDARVALAPNAVEEGLVERRVGREGKDLCFIFWVVVG